MVDFSLTEADRRLIALTHQENEFGRRFAREIDRTAEHIPPKVKTTHPDLADIEHPYKILEKNPEDDQR